MAEPINDERLRQLRGLVDFPSGNPINCDPVNLADVAGLIARLDAAEAKLARIAKLLAPRDYIALPTLIVIKEIVDG